MKRLIKKIFISGVLRVFGSLQGKLRCATEGLETRLFLIIILAFLFSMPVFAFRNEIMLSDPAKEQQAQQIFKTIRCVVCKGESLAESNADLAVDMRSAIRDKVAAGQGGDEIRQYLAVRYGETILQKPPFEQKTYILWLMPLVLLTGGAIIIARIISRKYGQRNESSRIS